MASTIPTGVYRLRSRLLLLVTLLVGLVSASAAGTVLTAVVSRNTIATSHEMEVLSRRAALLSVLAREQYIHEAHTIILADRSHVAHHDAWVRKLGAELDVLRPDVDALGATSLDAIGAASRDLAAVFSQSILPAIDRKDTDEVRRAHDRANALVDDMTRHADALAAYFERRAVEAEQEAVSAVQIAFIFAVGLGAVAAALALAVGASLWKAFSTPLASLELVAQKVALGERTARVGPVPAAELAVVAGAFNAMLDALARAEAEIVASERLAAIGRVAAGVAHEINNPIAVIRGYVKEMRAEAQSQPLKDELSIVDEEAAACQRIAEDLLAYARAPAMAPIPASAEQILREAAERCDVAPAGPDSLGASPSAVTVDAEPAIIAVDPLRIRQVIVNIVNNAREASPEHEPVIVRGTRHDDGYRIEVFDRGQGVCEEARERMFEPFFTTRRDGTGLGLAVCFGIVRAHGGTITAEPRQGGGTRFVVDLPGVLASGGEPSR